MGIASMNLGSLSTWPSCFLPLDLLGISFDVTTYTQISKGVSQNTTTLGNRWSTLRVTSNPHGGTKAHVHGRDGGTRYLATRNSNARRPVIPFGAAITMRFYRRGGPCRPVSRKLMVKKGPFIQPSPR
ncbi:hypothetical protein J3458_009190 [Metarhizium acridum]|uniref:uncharacterized protein n=1 Tax=Metarhizium acridum TaxID=92637 RepID=UPI001C6CDC81|nr:hypothetical protein J3458_009190 [Metarhizium acridum]